ncbi:protein canopy homolog 4 isoform X2 [Phocoena sinus]|uniref:protein canopy homolog 4 isoform X2 n=1 Tax=Phocoena sinus TaxID=42100 RepID=UPI0013C514C3|nr:protein canopy homolog 4 isoform X2 [Phocoena sinus]
MGPVRLGMLLFILTVSGTPKEEDDDTERLPSKCEVCKLLSLELQDELSRTGRSREVLELGQVLDTGKRKRHIPYSVSETRLEEALENLCERILDYSVHAERKGSLRYAKCETMLEEFEDVVGDWYFHHQEQPLQHFSVKVMCSELLKLHVYRKLGLDKEKITDGQEKTEEEEEEVTNTPGPPPKHDPEEL